MQQSTQKNAFLKGYDCPWGSRLRSEMAYGAHQNHSVYASIQESKFGIQSPDKSVYCVVCNFSELTFGASSAALSIQSLLLKYKRLVVARGIPRVPLLSDVIIPLWIITHHSLIAIPNSSLPLTRCADVCPIINLLTNYLVI